MRTIINREGYAWILRSLILKLRSRYRNWEQFEKINESKLKGMVRLGNLYNIYIRACIDFLKSKLMGQSCCHRELHMEV